MGDNLNITIRVMPSGEEHDLELSRFTTGREIIDALLDNGIAKRVDPEGNPYTFKLISKVNNIEVSEEKTLHDANIQEEDTLFFIPDMVAG